MARSQINMPRTTAGPRKKIYPYTRSLNFPGSGNVTASGPAFGTAGTIMFWIKKDTSLSSSIFVFDSTNGHRYLFYQVPDTGWGFYLNSVQITDNGVNSVPKALVDNNQWTHVAITWDNALSSNKEKFYKNGNLFTTRNVTISTSATPTNFYINQSFAATGFGTQFITDFIVCNAAETVDNINAYLNQDVVPPSAINRWRFTEGTGTNAADSVGSNPGTLSSNTLWSATGPLPGRTTAGARTIAT